MALIKNTIIVSFCTLCSRVLGYVRDALIASALGAGSKNDLFILALRIPNLFRTLFGEGAFNTVFIPFFSKIAHNEGIDNAKSFAAYIQTILLVLLSIFIILLFIFMPVVIKVMAPGIARDIDCYKTAIIVTRIAVPYLFFISLVVFYGAMLNSVNKYFAFAMAPIILNITLIIALLLPQYVETLYMLCYGTIIAGVLELLWIYYFAYRHNMLVRLVALKIDLRMRAFFGKLMPCVIGSGVCQINVWVDTIFASLIPGAISYLYYADRIIQLPLALIGTALGTASLPSLSKYLNNDAEAQVGAKIYYKALDIGLFFAIPSVFGLYYMAHDIVVLLFGHGAFSMEAANKTSIVLLIFAFAVPAHILNKVMLSAVYAFGNTKLPAMIGVLCIFINLLLNYCLIERIGYSAIAIATTISSWVNTAILGTFLGTKHLPLITKKNITRCAIYIASSVIMLYTMTLVNLLYSFKNTNSTSLVLVLCGITTYVGATVILRNLINHFYNYIRGKLCPGL